LLSSFKNSNRKQQLLNGTSFQGTSSQETLSQVQRDGEKQRQRQRKTANMDSGLRLSGRQRRAAKSKGECGFRIAVFLNAAPRINPNLSLETNFLMAVIRKSY
jgi:hypothetical protein